MLRVHEVRIYLAGMFERGANRLRRNFIESDAENLLRVRRRDGDLFFWFLRLDLRFLAVLGLQRFFFGCRFLSRRFLRRRLVGRFSFAVARRLREHHRKMRRNGLAFAIGVARQVNRVGGAGGFPEIVDHLALAGDDLQGRLENLGVIEANQNLGCLIGGCLLLPLGGLALLVPIHIVAGQTDTYRLLGQVHHMPDGRFDHVVASQILVDRLRLSRRFDYD